MQQIRIGGVPEHFNLPWQLSIEMDDFKSEGIDLQWADYKGGTGAMVKDMHENMLDLAVLLTEGAISDIIKNEKIKIVQYYVKTPLTWGIHVPANSEIKTLQELKGKTFAISRYGSGSHLMAVVNANKLGWNKNDIKFLVVNNIDGAVRAFENEEAHAFMWEKFTTQPYVDEGKFRRIGECDTPWPCFVIAGRNQFLNNNPNLVEKLLDVINNSCKRFMEKEENVYLVSNRYNLNPEQTQKWFERTSWATDRNVNEKDLQKVIEYLYDINIIDKKVPPKKLCSDICNLKN